MSADSLLEVQNLHVSLPSLAGDVHILKGIDLSVKKGEAIGLTGPSGSGKSTLLMTLAGLELPSAGSVVMNGHCLFDMDEDSLARFRQTNIGIVFQSFHLIPTLTAFENVTLPLELAGMGKDYLEKAEAALANVGLAHRLDHYPGQLSGGEQQRVALARAVIAQPPVLLADEPTGNLDQSNGSQIMDLIFGLKDSLGVTLIMVTHDMGLAQRCDRIIPLSDGMIDAG
ncbi:MAG TPA: ABC transporter [Rhodobiaceae bacterium]|nr:ABC transporter [Rhodobiaceae bacterium]